MSTLQISEALAAALHELVDATTLADRSGSDRQAARRAIEQATLVALLARREGFGADTN